MPQTQPTVAAYTPATLRQGDTWVWSRTYPDAPAPSWTLTARLVSAAATLSATATADGSSHQVKFTAAQTAGLAPGNYTLYETVTNGLDRYTVGQGLIAILPDPGAATPADPRGPCRQAYDAAVAALTQHITTGRWQILELRIAEGSSDRVTKFHTPDECRRQLSFLRRLADDEDAARSGLRRIRPGSTIGANFGNQR